MAFQVCLILSGLVVGWIRKGSVWSIINVRLRAILLLPVAYLLQHISITYLTGPTYEIAVVVSYITLITFCALNVRKPGLVWTLGGTAANFVVMLFNGLRMPAYVPAVQHMAPGMLNALMQGDYGKSVAMSSSTHLNFLGDIFTFDLPPASLISVGDILFGIGLVIFIQYAMRASQRSIPSGEEARSA